VTGAAAGTIRFCTVADSAHYVGLVALVNSLRFHGHDDPITVLDIGLSAAERAELAAHCDVVDPPVRGRHAWLLAPHACLARPADVVVSMDTDVIVTAPLDGILALARDGRVCAFPDRLVDRWFAEWEHSFALPSPPRHQPYVNTALVAFSTRALPDLLREWARRCDDIEAVPSTTPPLDFDDPLALVDQDAFNALLMSAVASGVVALQPADASAQGTWQLRQTQVDDLRALRCSFRGTSTVLLHSYGIPKPWQPQPSRRLFASAYLRCLRRLVVGDDVALRSALHRQPWLAPGVRGAVVCHARTAFAAAWEWSRIRLRRS
jgi:hypothetical protein